MTISKSPPARIRQEIAKIIKFAPRGQLLLCPTFLSPPLTSSLATRVRRRFSPRRSSSRVKRRTGTRLMRPTRKEAAVFATSRITDIFLLSSLVSPRATSLYTVQMDWTAGRRPGVVTYTRGEGMCMRWRDTRVQFANVARCNPVTT